MTNYEKTQAERSMGEARASDAHVNNFASLGICRHSAPHTLIANIRLIKHHFRFYARIWSLLLFDAFQEAYQECN